MVDVEPGVVVIDVVVDRDYEQLAWAAVGPDQATLEIFFDPLDEEQSLRICLVGAHAAEQIAAVVPERGPHATLRTDAFHVIFTGNPGVRRGANGLLRPPEISGARAASANKILY